MPNTYAIVGAGAVGGYYGARLVAAGFDVSFLLHRDFDHVRRSGLRVRSPEGDLVLPEVNVFCDAAAMPRADVVIVAIKATANRALDDILPHLVVPGGTVVLLQNGLGGEESIVAAAGPARIVGGLSFVCSTKTGPGTIQHFADRLIELAPFSPDGKPVTLDASLSQLAAEFEQAGIPVRLFENLALARWRKLAWNIPFSGLCVALDADTRRIVDDPDALAMARALMAEVAAAAAACGVRLEDEFMKRMLDETIAMPAFRPSLKVDFDRGAPVEIEAIFGNPRRAAQRAGHPARLVEQLHRELLFMERNRRLRPPD